MSGRLGRWRLGRSQGEFRWEDSQPKRVRGGAVLQPERRWSLRATPEERGCTLWGGGGAGCGRRGEGGGDAAAEEAWRLATDRPLPSPPLPLPSPSPRLSPAPGLPRRTRSPRAALGRTPGLRAAAERPLALRKEPRRNRRGRRREPKEVAVGSRTRRRQGGRSSRFRGAHSLGQGWVPARPSPCPARGAETEPRIPTVLWTTGQREALTDHQQPPGGTASPAHPAQRPPPEPRRASRRGSGADWRPPAARGGGAARGHGRLGGVLARAGADPSPRGRRLYAPGPPPPPRPPREMEQRNRLGALGYLPPLLLHALLLFVADGERGNFAAAVGSGGLCWGRHGE